MDCDKINIHTHSQVRVVQNTRPRTVSYTHTFVSVYICILYICVYLCAYTRKGCTINSMRVLSVWSPRQRSQWQTTKYVLHGKYTNAYSKTIDSTPLVQGIVVNAWIQVHYAWSTWARTTEDFHRFEIMKPSQKTHLSPIMYNIIPWPEWRAT